MDYLKAIRRQVEKVMTRLGHLGFLTGLIVLCTYGLFYILSFAQMALPIPLTWKGGLWVVMFGLAKATQYTALLILGKEGWKRIRNYFTARRQL